MDSKIMKDGIVSITYDKKFKNWESDPVYNLAILKETQNYYSQLLRSRPDHTVFLKEVTDSLGLEKDEFESSFESCVGWHDDGNGDTSIDFGIFRNENEEFVKGNTSTVNLYFNTNMAKLY